MVFTVKFWVVGGLYFKALCKDAPGHKPKWTRRSSYSDFVRWYFSAQVMLFRSPPKFSTLGLAMTAIYCTALYYTSLHWSVYITRANLPTVTPISFSAVE